MRQQAGDGVQAFLGLDLVEDLLDAAGVVLGLDLDLGRIAQETGGQLADVVGVVAENSRVWRLVGQCEAMATISS